MARKVLTITIDAPGRDQGKVFRLTEMSASAAEKWGIRALLAIGSSGIEVPDDIAQSGLAGVATMGIRAFLGMSFAQAGPLLDEMFACVACMPDPAHPQVIRPLIEDDIEEVATRLRLREELITLHTGFSIAAGISRLSAALTTTAVTTSPIPTPPATSPT